MDVGGREMMALLLISGLLYSASASVTYTVGGTFGWKFPANQNQSFYDDQFKNVVLSVGDVLLFPFTVGQHDVYKVSPADAQACINSNPLLTYTTTNSTVQLTTSGTNAFICGFPGHCSLGMHLTVQVSGTTSNTSTDGPGPSSSTAPSPGSPDNGAAANVHSGFTLTVAALTAACAALLL